MSTLLSRRSLLAAAAALSLSATGALAQQNQVIRIGVTPGPHAEIVEQIKPIIAKKGYELKIFEFSDFVIPNQALDTGEIDVNSFQHTPYLDNQVKDRGYKIVTIAQTIVFPMGIYSKKVKSLADLKSGARVALPNDPTNGGRALLLLQANGLIKLKDGAGLKATPLDVIDNPKKIKLIELDAAQLARALDEVDAAAVNTNYAIPAGLVPTRDAIALEAPKSPYANIIAVRAQDKDKPEFKKLLKAYHSAEVKAYVTKEFKDSIVPAW